MIILFLAAFTAAYWFPDYGPLLEHLFSPLGASLLALFGSVWIVMRSLVRPPSLADDLEEARRAEGRHSK